uniref:Secreted protein n=1 Tax=Angiostrongylus cantonensis TaxID=6313 RepID=A0A0K0DA12_ANGCA
MRRAADSLVVRSLVAVRRSFVVIVALTSSPFFVFDGFSCYYTKDLCDSPCVMVQIEEDCDQRSYCN